MIEFIKFGDIFKLDGVKNYAHGCNCSGAMGKGIALQFRDKFPEMYIEYKKKCKEGEFNLGDVFAFKYDNGFVFNLATQKTWRTKADIKAIEESLITMCEICCENNIVNIALPKIGAGLGGESWEKIKIIIKNVSSNFPEIRLYVVENYSPAPASVSLVASKIDG